MTETLPAIVGDLDARIAPLVHALRRDGFATFSSCDGHGLQKATPYVCIEQPRSNGRKKRDELLRWFSERDAVVNVCEVFGNYTTEPGSPVFGTPARYIRVELFDDLIREAFAW